MITTSEKINKIKSALKLPPSFIRQYRDWHDMFTFEDENYIRSHRSEKLKNLIIPCQWGERRCSEIFELITLYEYNAYYSAERFSQYDGRMDELMEALRNIISE